MKRLLFFFLFSAIAVFTFSSCKKEDTSPTTSQKVQGTWIFDKVYDHDVQTGFPEYRDTTYGMTGDYFDFRSDNRIYSSMDGERDTVTYIFIDDSRMIIDGDTATIQVLNDTQFQLFGKAKQSPADYYEYTLFMKR